MVAIQSGAGNKSKIMAVGTEAKKMQGRAPRNIEIVRPMRDGVIADFVITERMLGMLIKKSHRRTIFGSASCGYLCSGRLYPGGT